MFFIEPIDDLSFVRSKALAIKEIYSLSYLPSYSITLAKNIYS